MPTAGEPLRHRITRATLDPHSPDLTIGGFLEQSPTPRAAQRFGKLNASQQACMTKAGAEASEHLDGLLRAEEEEDGISPGDEYDAEDETGESFVEEIAEDGVEEIDTSDKDHVSTIEGGHVENGEDDLDNDSDEDGNDDG